MGNIQMPQTAPAVIATPDATFYALFIADGTSGTTPGSLYAKDSAGAVTALTFSGEQAQDAIGNILSNTATITWIYDDASNTIAAVVPDGAITNAKLANMAQATFKMRAAAAGTGVPIDGTAAQAKTALAIANTDVSGLGTLSTQNGTFSGTHSGASSGTNTGDQTITLSTDATGSGTGTVPVTLATVNPNVGTFGSATAVPTQTVNGKGLTTAISNTPIAIAESQVTNLTTDLAAKVATSRAVNTTAPLTGGGALSSDLTLAMPAATTVAAGHMPASAQLKLSDLYKDVVVDGGVDPTGSADATAQIQALQDAMTNGGIIYVPPNTKVKILGTVNVTNNAVHFLGGARRTSLFCAGSATGDMFNITGDGVVFNNLRFTTIVGTTIDNAALRTAGYACNFTSASDSSGVTNSDILFQWSGIQSSGSLQFFHYLNIREYGNNAAGGACILVNGTGDRYMSWITTDNGSNPTGFAGVRVTECASLQLTNCNFIHTTTCLALEPATGKTVASVEATSCFFDTSVTGMAITPAGTGSVFRSKFVNCWFSSHTANGVTMTGAQWDGISFVECEFYGNVIGISCPTGGGNWSVEASRFAGNTGSGINVTAGATHFPQIVGNHIGPQAAFGVNGTGIIVGAGTYKGLVIANNDVVNNTTNATLGAVTVAAGEGGWYRIIDNAGINPLTGAAVTTPAVPASTVAAMNMTGRRVLVLVKNGTTAPTVFTLNGVVLTGFVTVTVTTGINYFILDPGGTLAFTYTVAPTWLWIGN